MVEKLIGTVLKQSYQVLFCVHSSGFKLTFDVTQDDQSVGAKRKNKKQGINCLIRLFWSFVRIFLLALFVWIVNCEHM